MEVICSLDGIVGVRYPRNGLNMFRQSGFSESVLDFDWFNECIVQGKKWEETMDNWRALMSVRVEEATRRGIHFKIAVGPHFEKKHRIQNAEKLTDALVKECIRYAGEYGCKFIVIPPLENDSREKCLSVNREFYLSLAGVAKKTRITVLLKNDLKNHNGHYVRGNFSEAAQISAFIDELNEAAGAELFGFCLDTGVCNMAGQNMYDFAVTLGSRLKSLYLYENDGVHYNHIMPFFAANGTGSQFDWLNLIRGLRAVNFSGLAIMDFSATLAALPLSLHPAMLEFAHKVSKYLEWQVGMEAALEKYPSRVLFGAGNMCRAYMKCYGKKYPPLYTCDNNSNVWGNEFCGLTVHNPKDLKSLPEDCAIFICNVYYDEIDRQLREMGIKNPIERFNDEFMPSFHFTRLESDAWKEQVK